MPYEPGNPAGAIAGGLLAGSQVGLQYRALRDREEQQLRQNELTKAKELSDLALKLKGPARKQLEGPLSEAYSNAGITPKGFQMVLDDPEGMGMDYLTGTHSLLNEWKNNRLSDSQLMDYAHNMLKQSVQAGNPLAAKENPETFMKEQVGIPAANTLLRTPQTSEGSLLTLPQRDPAYATPEAQAGILNYAQQWKPDASSMDIGRATAFPGGEQAVEKYQLAQDREKPKPASITKTDKYIDIKTRLKTNPGSVTDQEKAFADAYREEKAIGPTAYGESKKNAALAQPTTVWDTETKTKRIVTKQESLDSPNRYLAPTTPEAMEATPTNDMKVMQQSAPSVLTLANKVLERIDDKNLGPVKSRWREAWQGKVGTADPNFAALKTDTSLLATRLMKMHVGSRGGAEMIQYFKNQLEVGKQSPENMRSVINEIVDYANEVKSHRISPGGNNEQANNDPLGIR